MILADVLDLAMFAMVCVAMLAGFPVAFTLGGVALLFAGLGVAAGVFDARFVAFLPQRIFGIMQNEVLIAIPLFIFMGIVLERSRVAEDLLAAMGRLFGTMAGGLAISVSVVGMLLAASTGIVGATVVTMGLISLPTMLRNGYDPRFACGTICAAGTLGQIIPPSIVLVLLGDQISNAYQAAQLSQGVFRPETVSVGHLFAGALVPGLVLVGLYITYQAALAWVVPSLAPPMRDREGADEEPAAVGTLLRAIGPPAGLILAVLGSILGGIATPTEAAAIGAVGALLLAGLRGGGATRRASLVALAGLTAVLALTAGVDLRVTRDVIPLGDRVAIAAAGLAALLAAGGVAVVVVSLMSSGLLVAVVRSSARVTAMIFMIVVGAALFSLVFRGLGGDEAVHALLSALPGGTTTAVVVVMAVMFVLGFFLDFLEITFVVVPVVAPTLLLMGVDPVWLAVMMAVNLQTSFLTPPFGFALFYLRGVAPPVVRTGQIYAGVAPFVALQLTGLGLIALFPALATWLPEQLFG